MGTKSDIPPPAAPSAPGGRERPGTAFQWRASGFPRMQPQGSRGETAFAVGSRVLITANAKGQRAVELMREDGTPAGVRIDLDVQATITAWRPRRSAPPRYRVCASDGTEGWVDAANLRRVPAPPPPPPPPPVAIAKAPPKAPQAKARSSTPTRPHAPAEPSRSAKRPRPKRVS